MNNPEELFESFDAVEEKSEQTKDDAHYLSEGYEPILSLVERAEALRGDGSKKEENNAFIVALVRKDTNSAVVLSTRETYDRHRMEVQNMVSLVKEKKFENVNREIASFDTIVQLQREGRQAFETELELSNDTSVNESRAKEDFAQVVEQGVSLGASDFNIVKRNRGSYYAFSVDNFMTKKFHLSENDAHRMVSAVLQTESEGTEADMHEQKIISTTIKQQIYVERNGRTEKESVRLRAERVPCHGGYSLSVRIIRENQSDSRSIDELGFDAVTTQMLKWLSKQPDGIVLLVGPTGQGKTVTIKALYEYMAGNKKLVVIEDPVEYIIDHPHVHQQAVNIKNDLTLKKFIKSSLRQFPKVIGIAEVRDAEVGEDMVNAALSGHLMVSTLHAANVLSAPQRLDKIGVTYDVQALPGLIKAFMSQRLLPKLCKCKLDGFHPEFGKVKVKNPEGCVRCGQTGIKGREPVGEILVLDGVSRRFLAKGQVREMERHMRNMGWRSMRDHGIEKVKSGNVDPGDLFSLLGDTKDTPDAVFNYAKGEFELAEESNIYNEAYGEVPIDQVTFNRGVIYEQPNSGKQNISETALYKSGVKDRAKTGLCETAKNEYIDDIANNKAGSEIVSIKRLSTEAEDLHGTDDNNEKSGHDTSDSSVENQIHSDVNVTLSEEVGEAENLAHNESAETSDNNVAKKTHAFIPRSFEDQDDHTSLSKPEADDSKYEPLRSSVKGDNRTTPDQTANSTEGMENVTEPDNSNTEDAPDANPGMADNIADDEGDLTSTTLLESSETSKETVKGESSQKEPLHEILQRYKQSLSDKE